MMKYPVITLLAGLIALSPVGVIARPDNYKAANKEAYDTFRTGKYQEALDKYRYALDLANNGWDDHSCINMIGTCLKELKRYDEALEWYSLIPDLPDINDNTRIKMNEYIGDIYSHKRDFNKAVEYYLISLNSSTDFRAWASIQEKLARTYLQMENQEQAILYFQSAMKCQEPHYWAAVSSRRQLAGIYMKEKKYQEVIDLYKDQDLTKYPNWERNNAPSLCGQAAANLGNVHQAIDFYRQIPEDNYNKLNNLGRLHMRLKKYSDARTFYLQIGDNEKFNPRQRTEGLIMAGDCSRVEKSNAEAAQIYRKALGITKDKNQIKQLEYRLKQVTPSPKKKK